MWRVNGSWYDLPQYQDQGSLRYNISKTAQFLRVSFVLRHFRLGSVHVWSNDDDDGANW